jgi:hypothetical protein
MIAGRSRIKAKFLSILFYCGQKYVITYFRNLSIASLLLMKNIDRVISKAANIRGFYWVG